MYPLDATFDDKESVPEKVSTSKRYKNYNSYSIQVGCLYCNMNVHAYRVAWVFALRVRTYRPLTCALPWSHLATMIIHKQEVVEQVKSDFGTVDYVVHSLANGPEVTKALLDTSREGYLAASSASAYSLVSMVSRFGPIINPGALLDLHFMFMRVIVEHV